VKIIEIKVLRALLNNARAPLKTLAKEIGISRELLTYHMKNLEEKGIIMGYETRINLSKFSVGSHNAVIKLRDKTKKKELCQFLSILPYTHYIGEVAGNWDLLTGFTIKKMSDLHNYISSLYETFGENIQDHEVLTELEEIKDDFSVTLDTKDFTSLLSKKGEFGIYSLDTIDKEILKKLTENARVSAVELGEELKISSVAIAKRIKKLEKEEIILGYRTILNLSLLGEEFYYYFFNIKTPSKENEKKVKQILKSSPHILYASHYVGKYTYLVGIYAKNNKDYARKIDEINHELPEMKNSETVVLLDLLEHTYFPKDYL
jgi:DNA-binding Lrp family transcriptional regulator